MSASPAFSQALTQLNPDQLQAVTTFDGPVLVVAGPGTGKTQVLTMRIAYILQNEEIKPQNILALTFTESGVAAMKERLIQLIGPTGYYVQIQTFHSFCNDIILEFPDKFSYRTRDFTNLTDIERFKIIRKLIDELPLEHLRSFRETYFYVQSILKALQDLKKEGISPADFEKIVTNYSEQVLSDTTLLNKNGSQGERYRKEMKKVEKNKELALVYAAYQKELETLGRYDYEDMIMFVVQKLKTDEELLRTLQERYHHFLIDEYQDTNGAQNFVVYQLAHFFDNPNLFVVGDDDQSIYRFQGASLENMLYLNDKFKNITTVVLHTNYRSTQTIIDASTNLIRKNEDRITNPRYGFQIDKSFVAVESKISPPPSLPPQGGGNIEKQVLLLEFSSGEIENYFLVQKIQELLQQNISPQEIAVIYRNNRDAVDVINTFNRAGVPWVMEGGFDILRDNAILKIIELLRLIADPDQQDLFFRVLHHEAFELLPLDLMKLSRAVYNHKNGLKKMVDICLDVKKLQENGIEEAEKLQNTAQLFLSLHQESQRGIVLDLVEKVLRQCGVLDFYLRTNDLRTLNRINSLFTFIKKENYKNHQLRFTNLLADLAVMENENISLPEQQVEMLQNGVHLMTAHKSKGLEFTYVFLVKAIDGKWGNPRKTQVLTLPPNVLQEQALAEIPVNEDERRLFYVALTRAKQQVFISYAHSYPFLDKTTTIPSQFISEIDPAFFIQADTSAYEAQTAAALQLTFQLETTTAEEKTADFLRGLVEKYKLNAVAMNDYLKCPRLFQYNHLVRVPQTKSKLQEYGTAMHAALEKFFTEWLHGGGKSQPVPTKGKLLEWYTEALETELIDSDDFAESLAEGQRVLSKYYDFYHDKFVLPLYLERDYNRIPIVYEGIPLAGKVDKIEAAGTGKIRVVDYKTGRPRSENEIRGLTKNGDKGYWYQLQFYKLLTELDRDLQTEAVTGMLDFVFPDKDTGEFRQVEIAYSAEDFAEFKQILKEVYAKIQNLEFPKTTNLKHCEECPYRKICWKDTLF